MKNKNENNNKWELNTQLDQLKVNDRKDALVLLYFLNEHQEQHKAFKELKSHWVNNIYRLPETSAKSYNSIKNGRYNILIRMKRIYKDYMVKLQPEEWQ